jgi:gliding motility-associated-like protein
MKRFFYISAFVCSLLHAFVLPAQPCDPNTPVFTADLSGSPDSNWYSPSIQRLGYCCSAAGSDVCIEFIVTLDTGASGISFNIASGAVPPGALYYQVNCGVPIMVGQPICLNGVGPHLLTFCKPGNNKNSFSITSIPKSNLTISVSPLSSPGCPAAISVSGLQEASITCTALPPNPVYDGYLDCPSGCDTILVTPAGSFPSFVDYVVCGNPIGGCAPGILCDTVRVNFSPDPVVTISPPSTTLCNGTTSITLMANPSGGTSHYHFQWSNGQTTQSIVAGAGTHTVVLTDSLLCSGSSDAVTITVLPPVTANAGADRTVCADVASVNLNGSVTVATGGLWHGAGTFSPSNTSLNASYTPTAAERIAGQAVLILESTGNQGCPAAYDTLRIILSPLPSPSVTGPSSPCLNSTATYTAQPLPGGTTFWNASGGAISGPANGNSATVIWSNPSQGTVTVTQTTAAGCSASQSYPVTMATLPVPVINGNFSLCQNSAGTYTVYPVTGSTYAWQVTGGTLNGNPNSSTVIANWTTTGSGTVTVTETDSNGCAGTSSRPVSLLPPVIANAGPDITVCADAPSVNLNGSVQGATGGAWWGGAGAFNPENTALNAVYVPSQNERTAGFVNLILETTGNGSCPADYDTVRISFAALPVPVISGSPMLCAGTTGTYAAQAVQGNTYNWTVNSGTLNNAPNQPTANITWSMSSAGTVSLTQTNPYGCSATQTLNVSLVTMAPPVVTGSATACQFSTLSYSVTPVPGSTYQWFIVGGNIQGSTASPSISVTWTSSGLGNLRLVETNSFGCVQTYSLPVSLLERSVPVLNGSGTACTGSTYTYTASQAPNTSYSWNVAGGSVVASNGSNSIQVRWGTGSSHSVSLTAVNTLSGCDTTLTLPVWVAGIEPPVVQASSTSGCPPFTVTFTGNNPAPGQWYEWSFGDSFYSGSANPTHTFEDPGVFQLVLVTHSANGCSDTATATITVYNKPDASFTQNFVDESYYVGEDTLRVTNTSTGATHYLWTFGTADTSNAFEPAYRYKLAGEYPIELFAFSAEGCMDTASSLIHVKTREHLYVPTAFSPNGDNINDYFFVLSQNISSLKIMIFNRWGKLFYSSEDVHFRWDGTCDGNQVQNGVYAYILTARGENGADYKLNGTITLVR